MRSTITSALLFDLANGPGLRRRIEARPPRFAVGAYARPGIKSTTVVEDGLDPHAFGLVRLDADKRAATANALSIDMGLFVRMPGLLLLSLAATGFRRPQ